LLALWRRTAAIGVTWRVSGDALAAPWGDDWIMLVCSNGIDDMEFV
jgi:hypothetical protein